MEEVEFKEIGIGDRFKLNTYTWLKLNDNVVTGILTDSKSNAVIVNDPDAEGWKAYISPTKKVETCPK